MGSPLPPDPYLALGVAKDATAAAIKTQYRKLVLKCHPDKIQDEALKQIAVDDFHKIQTAYEIVGDEERRSRYDAQCKLAELRKEMMQRNGARDGDRTESRMPSHKTASAEATRTTSYTTRETQPMYEERRPAYASTEYFDTPRTTARKFQEADRLSRRTSGSRDDRGRTRATPKDTKKSERADREQRNRRTTKDIRRDRDQKAGVFVEQDISSESDEYSRTGRPSRDAEDLRKAHDAYHEQARRQREEASKGYFDGEERSRKFFSQYDDAREYITRSRRQQEPERRPSPVRHTSVKEKISYVKGRDGRPTVVRRESTRPKVGERRRSAQREYEARPVSDEFRRSDPELVDEPREAMPRRPPGLVSSRSSPAEIRLPYEKQRAHSVQIERDSEDLPPQPAMRRAETMPHVTTRQRESRRTKEAPTPQRSSSPEHGAPPATKYHYGVEYADDAEYPTPDGYRTEVREPVKTSRQHRYARSPSPMSRPREGERERERDRDRDRDRERDGRTERRGAATRYTTKSVSPQRPTAQSRSTSTTYVYKPQNAETATRPPLSRENSSRTDRLLYGEVRASSTLGGATAKTAADKYSPPADKVRYQRDFRPEDLRPQTGYGYTRRPSEPRVSYTSKGSNNATPVYAR